LGGTKGSEEPRAGAGSAAAAGAAAGDALSKGSMSPLRERSNLKPGFARGGEAAASPSRIKPG
jgi:hypothetical protein